MTTMIRRSSDARSPELLLLQHIIVRPAGCSVTSLTGPGSVSNRLRLTHKPRSAVRSRVGSVDL